MSDWTTCKTCGAQMIMGSPVCPVCNTPPRG